jgi:hypothetical protein
MMLIRALHQYSTGITSARFEGLHASITVPHHSFHIAGPRCTCKLAQHRTTTRPSYGSCTVSQLFAATSILLRDADYSPHVTYTRES